MPFGALQLGDDDLLLNGDGSPQPMGYPSEVGLGPGQGYPDKAEQTQDLRKDISCGVSDCDDWVVNICLYADPRGG